MSYVALTTQRTRMTGRDRPFSRVLFQILIPALMVPGCVGRQVVVDRSTPEALVVSLSNIAASGDYSRFVDCVEPSGRLRCKALLDALAECERRSAECWRLTAWRIGLDVARTFKQNAKAQAQLFENMLLPHARERGRIDWRRVRIAVSGNEARVSEDEGDEWEHRYDMRRIGGKWYLADGFGWDSMDYLIMFCQDLTLRLETISSAIQDGRIKTRKDWDRRFEIFAEAAKQETRAIQTILVQAMEKYYQSEMHWPTQASPPSKPAGAAHWPTRMWQANVRINKLFWELKGDPGANAVLANLPMKATNSVKIGTITYTRFLDGFANHMDYSKTGGQGGVPLLTSPGLDADFSTTSDNIRSDEGI